MPAESQLTSERSRRSVLVVDDEEVMRILARDALEQAGFTVVDAENGERALELFAAQQPDIVLMDVRMPVMDGFEACRRLRGMRSGRHVPILMMTGLDDVDSITRSYQVGATDFINKPINWVILGHRVEYMLRAGRSAEELRRSRARLENEQRIAHLGSWEWSQETGALTLSRELTRILGRESLAAEIGLDELLRWIHEEDRESAAQLLGELVEGGEPRDIEYRLIRPDGSERVVEQQVEASSDARGRPRRIVGTVLDVTERKNAEEKIRFLAYCDSLTGLPNRRAFTERLSLALASASRRQEAAALLFLDLDRFKRINDTLGHGPGDKILQEVAERLLGCLRATDFLGRPQMGEREHLVARFGGDEFVVVLEIGAVEDAAVVARRLSRTLSEPFAVGHQEVFVTASIGITIYPHDGATSELLVKNAASAVTHAKERGGNNYQYYDQSMNASALERLKFETGLKKALERDEFVLHYQPKFNVATGDIVGAEALVRWRHPELGLIAPAKFIGLAEEAGLILELGRWVLRSACIEAGSWRAAGFDGVPVAVNLSPHQFLQPDLPEIVAAALRESGLEPSLLELELTESVLLEDCRQTSANLEALKSMGLRLTIDDFGTGYSSLSYLRRFPLDALKIDRSFISGLPEDPDHLAIARAIIAMAKSLNLEIVAEGVETREQLDFVRTEGCDEVQGCLFSRPLGASAFRRLLEQGRTAGPERAAALGA